MRKRLRFGSQMLEGCFNVIDAQFLQELLELLRVPVFIYCFLRTE